MNASARDVSTGHILFVARLRARNRRRDVGSQAREAPARLSLS
jgi:hypothetical protein